MLAKSERYIKTEVILGEGAYKTVTKAIDVEEGKEVAYNEVRIKQFERETQTSSSFSKEIALLKTIDHPNIIRILDYWFDGDEFIFITELMSGGSLADFIKSSGKVNSNVIRKWGLQILNGLSHLHTNEFPIIHRDIKSENIFVSGLHGEIKIGDLGIARERKHKRYTLVGTIACMAREMFEGDGYNEKVDLYAFGMCAIHMATGLLPYSECADEAEVKKLVMQGILPQAIHDIEDNCLKSLILCCMVSYKNRYSAKQCLQHHFFHPDVSCEGDCIPSECSTVLPLFKEGDIELSLIAFVENKITFQIQMKDYSIKDNFKFIKFDYDLEHDTVEKICDELHSEKVLENRPLEKFMKMLRAGIEKCITKRDTKQIIDGVISLGEEEIQAMDPRMCLVSSNDGFGSKTLEVMKQIDEEMQLLEQEKEKERKRDEELTRRLKAKLEHKSAKYEDNLQSNSSTDNISEPLPIQKLESQSGASTHAESEQGAETASSGMGLQNEMHSNTSYASQDNLFFQNNKVSPQNSLHNFEKNPNDVLVQAKGHFSEATNAENTHKSADSHFTNGGTVDGNNTMHGSPSARHENNGGSIVASTNAIYTQTSPHFYPSNVTTPNFSHSSENFHQPINSPNLQPQAMYMNSGQSGLNQNSTHLSSDIHRNIVGGISNMSIDPNPQHAPSIKNHIYQNQLNEDNHISAALGIYTQYLQAKGDKSNSTKSDPMSPMQAPVSSQTIGGMSLGSPTHYSERSCSILNNETHSSPGSNINGTDDLLQRCFNITRKKYLKNYSITEVSDDTAVITCRSEDYAKSWANIFITNDIRTVFDLKLLSFEDWEKLPLTIFAHRAHQDMVFGLYNVPLREKQFASNQRIKDYNDHMPIGDFIRDVCSIINKEQFVEKWERALIAQDIRTVEELKRLHPEDWNRLGLTVFCYRILKNVIFKRGSILYEG